MSGVYPMVSSSPPPFDEEEGDDWDEDFGNFMGAGHDVPENSISQDWAAFPDSGSNNTPTKISTSTQENSNITEENISTKSMELKLDANGSSLITGSDSGLDLNSSHCTESVSQKGLGTVPHVDSGLFSSEVSPSDPPKNCDKGNGAGKTLRESTNSSSPSEVLNEDSNGDFSNFETCPGSLLEDRSDIHTSGSSETDKFDSDQTVNSEIEIPVQDSVSDESKAGIHEDSTSTDDPKTDKGNEEGNTCTISEGEGSRNLNENINSSTSDVLDIRDKENEKSISVQSINIEVEISENSENPSSLSDSYFEEKTQTQDLYQESESIKDTSEMKNGAIKNTCSNVDDKYCENEEEQDDVLITTGVHSKGESLSVAEDQNLAHTKEDVNDACREKEETSDSSVTSVPNNAVEDDEFDDFADFDSAPLSDEVQVNEENNKTEAQENKKRDIIKPDDDDDFDDFADFNSPPSNEDTEVNSENKSDDQEKSSPMTEDTKTTSECTVLKQDDDDDDDDFDDFADFNSSPSNNTEVISENNEPDEKNPDIKCAIPTEDTIIKSESTVIKHDDDDDDFDDFADFDSAAQRDAEKGSESEGQFAAFSGEATEEDSGNWASFQETTENTVAKDDSESPQDEWSNQGSGQWKDGDEDEWQDGGGDDFGDFGDFDEPEPPQPRQSEKVDELSDRTVTNCFLEDVGDVPSVESVAVLEDYVQNKESTTQDKPPKVWNSLTKQMAESPLKWSQSRSSKQLLSSLHIDTRNILIGHKKPSVPIYASNLTLLEPTKGPAKSTNPEPTLVNTSKEEPQKQDIPPVQFDWSSSGLTNPLQGNNSKSLDLDFLVVQETESGGRSGVFDSELMHGQKPNLQPLESILASMKVSTVKKSRHTDKLGTEAARIIKSLPDLSFMQAKVLMFPIRHQAE